MEKKRWLDLYDLGTPKEIENLGYSSLLDLFNDCVEKFPKKKALTSFGQTLTFEKIDELSKKFASFLVNQVGLQKQERVAIMLPNIIQYPICLLGVLRAGLVTVNISLLYNAKELKALFIDSEIKALITLDSFSTMSLLYEI